MALSLVLIGACGGKAEQVDSDVPKNKTSSPTDGASGAAPGSEAGALDMGADDPASDASISVFADAEPVEIAPAMRPRFYVLDPVKQPLNLGPVDLRSVAETTVYASNNDGSVLVGGADFRDATGQSEVGSQVFRWTEATGVIGLGFLDGDAGSLQGDPWQSSFAFANSDASIIFGSDSRGSFRWTSGGGLESLGWIPLATDISLLAMSSDGRYAVASVAFQDMLGQSYRSAFWEKSQGWTLLPGDPGTPAGVTSEGKVFFADSLGVRMWTSASGLVQVVPKPPAFNSCYFDEATIDGATFVGSCSTNDPHQEETMRWTPASGTIGLGFLTGDPSNHPTFLSADGKVIIGESKHWPVGDTFPQVRYYRWSQVSGMVPFDVPSGYSNAFVNGMNDDGSAVFVNKTWGPQKEAFRWSQADGFVSLGFLAPTLSSKVEGVSTDGTLFVGSSFAREGDKVPSEPEAVIWDKKGVRAVFAELSASGVDTKGIHGTSGMRVWRSASSVVVQGVGSNSGQEDRAWVAILPAR